MPIQPQRHDMTNDSPAVLVFGATGKQGGAVASALKAGGWAVRALVRNPDSDEAKVLASGGVQLFQGDFSDLPSVRIAMAGTYGVFSVQPNSGSPQSGITDADEVRFGKAVADIAVETGVRHLVYTSAGIISKGRTGLDNLDTKIEIEDHIRSLNIASTIVRPATFMDLITLPGMGLDKGKFSFFLRPEQTAQFIAVEDIGKIVAIIFGETERYAGRTIEIAGDEVTGLDLQNALSDTAGHPILYQRFSDSLLADNSFLARNAKLFDEGRAAGNADITIVERDFGAMLNVKEWLAGPGGLLLQSAIAADS